MSKMRAVGTVLTYNSQTIGSIKTIGEVKSTADEIDVTTLDSTGGYKEFLQGFKDGGEVQLDGYFDGAAGQVALKTAYDAGTSATAEITWPSGGKLGFTAWVKSISYGNADVQGAVEFHASLRVTGGVTYTAPAAGGNT